MSNRLLNFIILYLLSRNVSHLNTLHDLYLRLINSFVLLLTILTLIAYRLAKLQEVQVFDWRHLMSLLLLAHFLETCYQKLFIKRDLRFMNLLYYGLFLQ